MKISLRGLRRLKASNNQLMRHFKAISYDLPNFWLEDREKEEYGDEQT